MENNMDDGECLRISWGMAAPNIVANKILGKEDF